MTNLLVSLPDAPWIVEQYRNREFYVTELLEGTLVEASLDPTGSTMTYTGPSELSLEDLRFLSSCLLKERIEASGCNLSLHGILINGKFLLTAIYEIDAKQFYDFKHFVHACHDMGLEYVPIIEDSFVLRGKVENLQDLAKGPSRINPGTDRKGLVFCLKKEEEDAQLGRVIFKVV